MWTCETGDSEEDQFDVRSAGTITCFAHPQAIAGMNKIGIDISNHRSKSVDELAVQEFDYVIAVPDNVNEELIENVEIQGYEIVSEEPTCAVMLFFKIFIENRFERI